MKKILVSLSTVRLNPTDYVLHIARETYLKKLIKFGHKVVFTSCELPLEHIREDYEMCDGVLFMGGGDFDPNTYGSLPSSHSASPNVLQDNHELSILNWVLDDKKAFLGICRGCQALGIASGGKLIQHIPEYLGNLGITDENHGLSEGGVYSDLTNQEGHEINILDESKAKRILGVQKLKINSGHHQSVESVGEGFMISGHSKAGIIEVIESIYPDHFCFGIQGHPEALTESAWDNFFKFEF